MIPLSLTLHTKAIWSSSWNGYEVGFPDSSAVDLFILPIDSSYELDEDKAELNMYVDSETNVILEMWITKEEA